jgi:hypothetical protein
MPGIITKAPTYVPYKNPTAKNWLGHFVDKEVGGEVDLTVTQKSGDTVTFTLNDKGRAAEEHRNAVELPLSPVSFSQDADLSNSKSSVLETFVVKNVAELQQGVVLSLLQAEGGQYMGPDTKIQYARPSRFPGKSVTFELSPFVAIPR